jgi:uncharacterized peroxidase-related enzyme
MTEQDTAGVRPPAPAAPGAGFLAVPATTPQAEALYDEDRAEVGFVMNGSRLWAQDPALHDGIFDLLKDIATRYGLTDRQRGILITACASTLGDSYCSVAWGTKLTKLADERVAAGVLRGADDGLTAAEAALAAWARKVTRDPNATGEADVQQLRDAGWTDAQIFAVTVFVGLRVAFATVNDALGARPDAAYRTIAPPAVLAAIGFGRPLDEEPPAP